VQFSSYVGLIIEFEFLNSVKVNFHATGFYRPITRFSEQYTVPMRDPRTTHVHEAQAISF